MGLVWWGWEKGKEKFWERWISSVVIRYDDDVYKWVNKYMTEKGHIKSDGTLKVRVKPPGDEEWFHWIFRTKDDQEKPDLEYLAGPGNHMVTFKGRTIWVNQREEAEILTGHDRRPTKPEYITLYCYGSDAAVLKDYIDAAVVHSMVKHDGKITIWEKHRWWWLSWTRASLKTPRPLKTVVLDGSGAMDLCDDIRRFQNAGDWYLDKGIPYRRGYLLWGPPGTGKTSFTQAIAGHLGLSLCYLNLSSGRMDDDTLNRTLNETPANSIILLEDIDGIFAGREDVLRKGGKKGKGKKGKGGRGPRITFAGLLNALDGIRSQEGRILFMTTNHKDKLDPALLRPGRADYHVKLDNASYG